MPTVEMPERCAVCPARGLCTPCRPLTVKGESGSGEVLVFKGGIKELLSLPRLPDFIYFGPARGGSGEPPIRISEKTCSECKKPASTCLHSETSKR